MAPKSNRRGREPVALELPVGPPPRRRRPSAPHAVVVDDEQSHEDCGDDPPDDTAPGERSGRVIEIDIA